MLAPTTSSPSKARAIASRTKSRSKSRSSRQTHRPARYIVHPALGLGAEVGADGSEGRVRTQALARGVVGGMLPAVGLGLGLGL